MTIVRRLCYDVYTMRHTVGIRELRQQVSSVLRRVAAGETIEITEHGHPIARIVPLRPGPLEQLTIERRATAPEGDLLVLTAELGLPVPSVGSVLPSAVLAELRTEER